MLINLKQIKSLGLLSYLKRRVIVKKGITYRVYDVFTPVDSTEENFTGEEFNTLHEADEYIGEHFGEQWNYDNEEKSYEIRRTENGKETLTYYEQEKS